MRAHILLWVLLFSAGAQSQCFVSNFSSLGQLSKSTGNYLLDQKFNASQADLQSLFGVRVDLYVYNDGSDPNAYAMRSNSAYYHGLVAFGTSLLTSHLWNMQKGEYAVAGVLAHEFAHVLQIKKGCSLSNPERELHADFLAGYYFGRRHYLAAGLNAFATELYSLGNFDFWSPNFHGTPAQRVEAMVAGYRKSNLPVDAAYKVGLEYVTDDQEETSCTRCNGEGTNSTSQTCGTCSGYGFLACNGCGGNGGYYAYGYNAYRVYGYWFYTCSRCGGAKSFGCANCSGSGNVTYTRRCLSCNGTGKN